MGKLFSPDSKFMLAMGRLADLILLNVCFLVCCLPVVTIGAAQTALYAVLFRLGTGLEPAGTVRAYFRAFRENFKQSTVLWLIVALCGGTAAVNTYVFYLMPGRIRWAFVVFALLGVLVVLLSGYAFPLASQFSNGPFSTLKNALVLSLGYLPRSVIIAALNVLPWVLLLTNVMTFFYAGLIWVGLYFAAAAYFNTMLLRRVFAPYLDEPERADDAKEDDHDRTEA